VFTDLAITGKPAQFGRGVISDVSDKLLEQFLSCVSDRFTQGLGAAEEVSIDEAAASTETAARGDEADTEQTIELEVVPAVEEEAAEATASEPKAPTAEPAPPTTPRVPKAPPRTPPQRDTEESTLDVLSTVGPVLLKRYGPALAVVGLLLFILIKIIRRKR